MERWVDTGAPSGKIIHTETRFSQAGVVTPTGSDTFFDQNADGSLTFFGDVNSVNGRIRRTFPAGYLRLKSPIQIGDRIDLGDVVFDDGSRLSSSFEVAAEETITVPAGTFKTFRVDAVETHTNPTNTLTLTQDGSYWIDPEVGVIQYKGIETKTRTSDATPLYILYLKDVPNSLGSVQHHGFQLTQWTPAGSLPVAAPRGVTATPSGSQITLDWDPVSNATSYQIYRPLNSGGLASSQNTIGTIPASPTPSFTDTPPNPGETYYYLVKAVGPSGAGPASVEVSAQTLSPPLHPDWSTQKSNTTMPLTAVVAKTETSTTHVYASGGGCNILDFLVLCGGVLLHSTDDGATWEHQTVDPMTMLSGLSFADVQHGLAVGENGVIQATSDGGATWFPQVSGSNQNLTGVYFYSDAQHGWAVGFRGTVLRTVDGGANWTSPFSGTTNTLNAVMFTDPDHGWAAGSGASPGTNCQGIDGNGENCATILQTSNGGQSWIKKNSGTTGSLNYHALSFPEVHTEGWIMGAGGTALHTTDAGGSDWVPQTTGTTSLHGAFFIDNQNGWAVSWGSVVHTGDGETWGIQYGPAPYDGFSGKTLLLAVTADPGNPASVFAVGWNGTILHSTNGNL
jgi:photosystem II stability/assembly factor-like uncharacterized protein